jgi:hypothetical protein
MTLVPRLKSFEVIVVWLFALLALSASGQIGGSGWTSQPVTFKVQWPYNVPESSRFTFTNGVHHMLVLNSLTLRLWANP